MEQNAAARLYAVLHRLVRQLHRFSHRLDCPGRYYREQSRLLLLIAEKNGVIQRDLAEEMDVRPSSMTEMLTKLEQIGLVTRKQDEKDQRVMHIYLTDEGGKAADESRTATAEMTKTLFGVLTEEETEELLLLSEKLAAHLAELDLDALDHNGFHGHHRGFEGNRGFERQRHGRRWHHRNFGMPGNR